MIGSLNDFLENYQSACMDCTVDGKCSGCGGCCTDFLPVSDAEIKRIRKYVKAHGIKAQKNLVANAKFDMTCPFRDDMAHRCTIYEVRPAICREFMCNYSPDKIDRTKELFHQKNKAVSFRKEIFGDDSAVNFVMAVRLLFAECGYKLGG